MNGTGNVIGQTLDDKYKIESEIGKGGMGTVYLATHLGTERPVALKIIAPEFMQRLEFVERFKREARAAGRLRHPNVVNVTDFGFADTNGGNVAYLVMEYLDGCTLGEILEEEERLPLAWTLDILEQVCSAVQEAHEQGIIHRDLKPDNIWLEPNQRGGYTVKVLDFGIAKLEEQMPKPSRVSTNEPFALTENFQSRTTVADSANGKTHAENHNATAAFEAKTIAQTLSPDSEAGTLIQTGAANSEAGTLIQSGETNSESGTLIQSKEIDLESGTAILTAPPIRTLKSIEHGGTKIITAADTDKSLGGANSTANLTRVGAVLGTPLYMSPEQCRGEKLSRHSDIYSLGVIAYQMLSGKTPFGGDYLAVMESHKEVAPPPLEAKRIPKKIKQVVAASLAKNVEDRPPTALAFASELRAQSEGFGSLYRRALVIYSEHLPKFLGLSVLLYLPIAALTIAQLVVSFLSVNDEINSVTKMVLSVVFKLLSAFLVMFCGYLIFGTITWMVAQILAVPLRPVKVRPALEMTRRRWKTFAGTGMLSAILTLLGYLFFVIPGFYCSIVFALVAPVVMMENLRGVSALRRSRTLVKRSLRTTVAAIVIMFFVPFVGSGLIAFMANATAKSLSGSADKIAVSREKAAEATGESGDTNAPPPAAADEGKNSGVQIKINGEKVEVSEPIAAKNMSQSIKETIREVLTELLLLPFQILIASFSSIVVALLYMKTRQVGGESMKDLLEQFEESEQPRSNWQRRVKARLEQSGKQTSRG